MISSSNDVYTFSTSKLTQIPYDHVLYKYAYKERQEFFQVPIQVYDDYLIGEKCFNYGKAFIIFGSISTVVGGCVYAIGAKHNKINEMKTGTGIMCGGSTLIGISIPLLCFGDNMKRATNREYKIYKR